jgi:alpha/beta hydrolase fold
MGGGSESVKVGGRTIAFERRGQGPPLVLLHGSVRDSRDWRPQLEALSDEFTVVAWDAPGCGGSFDPPEDYGLYGYADCLAAFVEALGLERPHVLGLSFGPGSPWSCSAAIGRCREASSSRRPTRAGWAAGTRGRGGAPPVGLQASEQPLYPDTADDRGRAVAKDASSC